MTTDSTVSVPSDPPGRHTAEQAAMSNSPAMVHAALSRAVAEGRVAQTVDWLDPNPELRDSAIRAVISCGRLGPLDAADIVLDASIKLRVLQPRVSKPRALLVTTALNCLRSRRRRHDTRTRQYPIVRSDSCDASELPLHEDPTSDFADTLAEQEVTTVLSGYVRAALERLPEAQRALLEAYYFSGRSLASIDLERGDKKGAAKLRVHRARKALRRLLTTSRKLHNAA